MKPALKANFVEKKKKIAKIRKFRPEKPDLTLEQYKPMEKQQVDQ